MKEKPKEPDKNKFVSKAELAAMFGLSASTIRRRLNDKKNPAAREVMEKLVAAGYKKRMHLISPKQLSIIADFLLTNY